MKGVYMDGTCFLYWQECTKTVDPLLEVTSLPFLCIGDGVTPFATQQAAIFRTGDQVYIGKGADGELSTVAGVVGAHAEGWLKPHVHKEYTREQLPDALEALGGGGTMGKVVVRW